MGTLLQSPRPEDVIDPTKLYQRLDNANRVLNHRYDSDSSSQINYFMARKNWTV